MYNKRQAGWVNAFFLCFFSNFPHHALKQGTKPLVAPSQEMAHCQPTHVFGGEPLYEFVNVPPIATIHPGLPVNICELFVTVPD